MYVKIVHGLGKARPTVRRAAGQMSSLKHYPPLGAMRSFSIILDLYSNLSIFIWVRWRWSQSSEEAVFSEK
jgi:hypothetical protein